jgi:type I restriction enzyme S subunit
MELSLPSIEEQSTIANFLTAIDQKITQLQTQIEKTDHYKKGLLQKLFC